MWDVGLWRLEKGTYVGPLLLVRALEHIIQNIHLRPGLYGDAGLHAALVDVADQLARARLEVGGLGGGLGGGGEGGLVVEAVEVAAGGLEFLDPLLGLWETLVVLFGKVEGSGGRWEIGQARAERTSAIIMWQSNVPFPNFSLGPSTWPRILVTTGGPNVIFGTKCPSLRSRQKKKTSSTSPGTSSEQEEAGATRVRKRAKGKGARKDHT